jgi:superfamily I DNA/RNA helicase
MKVDVIFGPPGTGKSRYLIEHVSDYLDSHDGVAMVCSHTKAAAKTIVDRWSGGTRMRANTLHSFCFNEMRLTRAQVVDDAKLDEFLKDFGLDTEEGGDGKQYMDLINYAGAMDLSIEGVYGHKHDFGSRDHFIAVARSYMAWKNTFGYMDFNDMLKKYTKHDKIPDFGLLAIDEAQDLSILHWRVIHRIMELRPDLKVMVAGDDDQSLFSYAGVDPQGMAKFAEEFNGTVKVLEQSYRVPKLIHGLAHDIITRVENRVEKVYRPVEDRQGSIWYRRDTEDLLGDINEKRDTLILYSDKFIRAKVEELLKDMFIPYSAFSGFPSPLQTAGGQSLRIAARGQPNETELKTIRRGLSERASEVWDRIGPQPVLDKLRDRDLSQIKTHWSNENYFKNVDLTKDIDNVRISTIHGAKGSEAESVHLITGVSQAAIDYSNLDPDALHRLFYVGVTRTKNVLHLYEDENAYPVPKD